MKIGRVILSVIFILVLFITGRLVYEHNFQLKAENKLKESIDVYFEEKEEMVIKVASIDYSLGQLETSVETNKNTYYILAGDTTPLICRYTILNFFAEPSVKILGVYKKSGER